MNTSAEVVANTLSDEAIIAQILAGEKRQYELLMRKYNPRLYKIGMSILENDMDAEEAMQTAYINAYQNLANFEGRSSFGTWLTRIMLNQCYEQKRKRKLIFSSIEQPDNFVTMKTPANTLAAKELGNVIEKAIAQLPEKYRLVFVMREIEGMSVRETATTLSLEETNVKVRFNRAKAMLREALNGYMKDHVYGFHLTRCDRVVNNVFQQLGI